MPEGSSIVNLFEYDESLNIDRLCGIDEAGRGPLAGPVFAAAVILPKGCVIDGLNDSKKLSEKYVYLYQSDSKQTLFGQLCSFILKEEVIREQFPIFYGQQHLSHSHFLHTLHHVH